jgi:hypothetical protein
MNRDELWSKLAQKNPRLVGDPHFTPVGIRQFFDAVYNAGWRSGVASSKAMPSGGHDLFKKFFGGK